jgi:hypothetical protein
MLSDKYFWPVPELTPVHKMYKLVSFQEPVTLPPSIVCPADDGDEDWESFYVNM